MPRLPARVVAFLLIAIQVIGGAWLFGGQICLAGEPACGAAITVAAAEAECCCGHDEDRAPAEPEDRDPCGSECGCCVQIPAPDQRGIEIASVREAEATHGVALWPQPVSWSGHRPCVERLVRPPPDVGLTRIGAELSGIRMQV